MVQGDATRIPLGDQSVDAVTIGFGIRNVENMDVACAELYRVMKPRGRLAILEFVVPTVPVFGAVYGWYVNRVLPRIGRALSRNNSAYAYLPASISAFATPDEFVKILRRAGFGEISPPISCSAASFFIRRHGGTRDWGRGLGKGTGPYELLRVPMPPALSPCLIYCSKHLMYFDLEDYHRTSAGRPSHILARGRAAVDHCPSGDGDPDSCGAKMVLAHRTAAGAGGRATGPAGAAAANDDGVARGGAARAEAAGTSAPSDLNRAAASPERAKKPENMEPFSRGNTPSASTSRRARTRAGRVLGRSAAGRPTENPLPDPSQKIPESQSALQMPSNRMPSQNGANGRSATSGGSLGDALPQPAALPRTRRSTTRAAAAVRPGDSVRHQGRRVRPVDPALHRAGQAQLAHPVRGDVDEGHVAIQFNVHKDGSITDLQVVGASAVDVNNAALGALSGSNPPSRCRRNIPTARPSSPSPSSTTRRRRGDPIAAARAPDSAADVHRLRRRPRAMKPLVVAVLGPTATGKSALALAIAERYGGEIVNCDSTAVYAASTSAPTKSRPATAAAILHHLIDIADPTDDYTAAQYARDAAAAIRESRRAGGCRSWRAGPGLYFALTRGLFRALAPTPRCAGGWNRSPSTATSPSCTGCCAGGSGVGAADQSRDLKRLVRALEVFF
jgi:hypothetical protein